MRAKQQSRQQCCLHLVFWAAAQELHGLTMHVVSCRIAGPCCALIGSKVLKQRPATVKRALDVCLNFVELEQAEAVEVRHHHADVP